MHVHAKSLQSCPILRDPMVCSLPGSSVHGILQVRKPEWVAMPSSRRSSPPRDWTHVSCRQILYHLSHQGSSRILEWVAYPFSRGSFWPRNLHCKQILYQLSYQGSPVVRALHFYCRGPGFDQWLGNCNDCKPAVWQKKHEENLL